MRAAGLSKNYQLLTPGERLALMLSAAARGDDAEHHRLTAAAPRVTLRVPDAFGRAMALREVLDGHRMELLALAAHYFATPAAAGARYAVPGRSGTAARCLDVGLMFGYLFRVHADGWWAF